MPSETKTLLTPGGRFHQVTENKPLCFSGVSILNPSVQCFLKYVTGYRNQPRFENENRDTARAEETQWLIVTDEIFRPEHKTSYLSNIIFVQYISWQEYFYYRSDEFNITKLFSFYSTSHIYVSGFVI